MKQSLMHDVVKMGEEVRVWGDILAPLHDPADQLVGVKFTLLITFWQHGGLQTLQHSYNEFIKSNKNRCGVFFLG